MYHANLGCSNCRVKQLGVSLQIWLSSATLAAADFIHTTRHVWLRHVAERGSTHAQANIMPRNTGLGTGGLLDNEVQRVPSAFTPLFWEILNAYGIVPSAKTTILNPNHNPYWTAANCGIHSSHTSLMIERLLTPLVQKLQLLIIIVATIKFRRSSFKCF